MDGSTGLVAMSRPDKVKLLVVTVLLGACLGSVWYHTDDYVVVDSSIDAANKQGIEVRPNIDASCAGAITNMNKCRAKEGQDCSRAEAAFVECKRTVGAAFERINEQCRPEIMAAVACKGIGTMGGHPDDDVVDDDGSCEESAEALQTCQNDVFKAYLKSRGKRRLRHG